MPRIPPLPSSRTGVHKLADSLEQDMIGVWWLLSREDFASDGSRRIDPTLGADPLGILTFAPGRFAA